MVFRDQLRSSINLLEYVFYHQRLILSILQSLSGLNFVLAPVRLDSVPGVE